MPIMDRERRDSILSRLRQRTALTEGELLDLQTTMEEFERALSSSHHTSRTHHTGVTQEVTGVLERRT